MAKSELQRLCQTQETCQIADDYGRKMILSEIEIGRLTISLRQFD